MTPYPILIAILGLTTGNVVAAALHDGDFQRAVERSFFQAVAILLYVWIA